MYRWKQRETQLYLNNNPNYTKDSDMATKEKMKMESKKPMKKMDMKEKKMDKPMERKTDKKSGKKDCRY